MIQTSSTVDKALYRVSLITDNIFSKTAIDAINECNDIPQTLDYSKIENIKKQLPHGIYTNIGQLLDIINKTISNITTDSTEYSPISISFKEFQVLKPIKYDSGNIITGRDDEINKMLLTMCKKDKRGIILVGSAGTGKTSLVKALNAKLLQGTVPKELIGSTIYNLDVPYLFSKFKDEAVNYIIKSLELACDYDKAIIFIDEVHQVLSQKLNDVLKPYLTEKIRFIGSTTIDEYYAIVTQDPAIERRFTIINVEEPNIKQTIEMIKKTKTVYEDHHRCIVPDDVCEYLVSTGSRFLGTRKNPDKSLDILDIACSILNKSSISIKYDKAKDNKDINKTLSNRTKELDSIKVVSNNRILTIDHVNRAISSVSNIDYNSIRNSLEYDYVKDSIINEVIDQVEGIENLSNVVNIIKHINYDQNRPLSTILLAGPAGVGKKESAKCLAGLVFGDENHFIEYDMSGLTSEFMITELKGSPPGYVGYGKSGGLIKAIRNNPQSVIYFKNIHKADNSIIEYVLNCIRNGRMIDSAERSVYLNNAIIIFGITLDENDYDGIIKNHKKVMGFTSEVSATIDKVDNLKKVIAKAIVTSADEIIIYNRLSKDTLEKIYSKNKDKFISMYKGIQIDESELKTKVLSESENGHDLMSRLAAYVPKLIYSQLKQKGK